MRLRAAIVCIAAACAGGIGGPFPACAVAKATDANVRSSVRMAIGRKP
jgi:hypothetical protein